MFAFYVGKGRWPIENYCRYMAKKNGSRAQAKKDTGGKIVIDAAKGLVFANEEELFKHFSDDIEILEKSYFGNRKENDVPVEDFGKYEECLSKLLSEPAEIWTDNESLPGKQVSNFIAEFEQTEEDKDFPKNFYYVAQVYLSNDTPSFVYLHFPTTDAALVDRFKKSELIYDRNRRHLPAGAAEGDALSEKEPLAEGLYQAMIKVRGESDFKEEEFPNYFHLRETTIEEPDEIWRSTDTYGNVLVNFVKEFPANEANGSEEMFYVAVTQEDSSTESHMLLFSFPTKDKSLVERYRHGENMYADEVVQESSH